MNGRFALFRAFVPVFLFCAISSSAFALEVTIGSVSGTPDDSVSINITVDDPAEIAGMACTVTYNTNYFTLTSIESTFFDSFLDQWQSLTPVPDPLPPTEVTVDGKIYTQPVLASVGTDKALIVGARVKAGVTDTTLFTLNFSVSAQVPDGIYPVSISPISLNNVEAGYPTGGETIPVLVGAIEGENDPTLAFPALSSTLVNGVITINTSFPDVDGDGIDDNWELRYFGDLDTADATSDYDGDGYTDLQEFLNQLAGENDPQGEEYDPKIKNAPGGTGYKNPSNSFWNLMLPAILRGVSGP